MAIRGIPVRSRHSIPPFTQATLGVLDAYLPRFRKNRRLWPRWHGDLRVWEEPELEPQPLAGSWPWTPQFLVHRLLKEAGLGPWSVTNVRRNHTVSDEDGEEDIEHPYPSLWVRLQAAYLSMAHSKVPKTLIPWSIEETYFVTPYQLVTWDFLGPGSDRRIQDRFGRTLFDLQPRIVAFYERLAAAETKSRKGGGLEAREQARQARADLIAEAESMSATLWAGLGLTPSLEKGKQLWVSDRAILELESEARVIVDAIWNWEADPNLLELAGELLAEDEASAEPGSRQDVGRVRNLLRSGGRAEAAAREIAFPFLLPAEVEVVMSYRNKPATAAKQLLVRRLDHRVEQPYIGEIIRRELGRNTP